MSVTNMSNEKQPWQFSASEKNEYIEQHGRTVWDNFVEQRLNSSDVSTVDEYAKNFDKLSREEKNDLIDKLREIHPERSSIERVKLYGRITDGRYSDGYKPETP